MANFVKCRFVLIGNEAIDNLVKEINKRIVEDKKINPGYSDNSRVGRILYGLNGEEAYLSYDEVGAKWIHDDQDYDGLGFVGGGSPVRGFQDHLVRHASKLDPKLIVLMIYEDEAPNFVGARYALMKEGNIAEYDFELNLENILVSLESDYDDAVDENKKSNQYEEVILWEDLYNKLEECKKIAFTLLKKDNSWISKDYLKRSPDDYFFIQF